MSDFADHVASLVPQLRVAPVVSSGQIVRVVGLTLEAKGVVAPLGAYCQVENSDSGAFIDAEVVGFQADLLYL
ncbi:MAG: flagellum-specific ATP synthase FliI, partial [Porticoccaceae bacterium]|nr:flagellum-specific ATP synthase FliI [Porticoccaceae bacterium]